MSTNLTQYMFEGVRPLWFRELLLRLGFRALEIFKRQAISSLSPTLSLAISRKLSWRFSDIFHLSDEFRAHVLVFDWFYVPLRLRFVQDKYNSDSKLYRYNRYKG